jgi:uncharacterized MAPEG superfamily protein
VTAELWLLLASALVYGLYLGAQSTLFRVQNGVTYAASARDDERAEGALLGRAERALRNYHETWLVFVILALIGHLAYPGDPLLFWGAIVWLAARLVYLPLYLGGIFMLRSIMWTVALAGLCMMGWAIVF